MVTKRQVDVALVASKELQLPIPFPLLAAVAPAAADLPSYPEDSASYYPPIPINSVVAEERSRIARDLHDGVGQSLACLKLKTRLLRSALNRHSMAWLEDELEDWETLLSNTIAELRCCVYGLRPVYLEGGGLLSALLRLIEEFNRLRQHRVQLDWVGHNNLPQPVEDAFFRTSQEALNNTTKHAQAKWVLVKVEHLATQMRLIIQDDGMGCLPQAVSRYRGFGLVQMRERIEALGGTLTIESSPRGTRLMAVVPKFGRASCQ